MGSAANPPEAQVSALYGQALGAAYTLRNAAAMAAAGQCLLPGLGGADLAALGRGETTAAARAAAQSLAEDGMAALKAARQYRGAISRPAIPVVLTAWRAERDLRAALRPGADLARDFPPSPGAARSLGLAWRALSGRW